MDATHTRVPSVVELKTPDGLERLIASNVVSNPVMVAEAIARPALLWSTSLTDNGNYAENNEPTGGDASIIHPIVSSHRLTVKCEGLLALYLITSVIRHYAV